MHGISQTLHIEQKLRLAQEQRRHHQHGILCHILLPCAQHSKQVLQMRSLFVHGQSSDPGPPSHQPQLPPGKATQHSGTSWIARRPWGRAMSWPS